MRDYGMISAAASLAVAFFAAVFEPIETIIGKVDHDALELGVALVADDAVFLAYAAGLEPTPGRGWVDTVVVINPNNTRLD